MTVSALRRVYHPTSLALDDEVYLSSDVRHHLIRVCRCQMGDCIDLFTGDNHIYTARIVELTAKKCKILVVSVMLSNKESRLDITLAQVVPRARSMDWIVEKATELGVKRLLPIRGVQTPASHVAAGKLHHWREKVIAASQQSGRNVLMELLEPMLFDRAIEMLSGTQVYVLHPNASAALFEMVCKGIQGPMTLLLGSEAGFSESELVLIKKAGFPLLHLGARTLRVETASLAALALLMPLQ
jgi:16S rRNA (uracil1498-N3)-methyltransferase